MSAPSTLILNGSPHTDGNSVFLARMVAAALGGHCRIVHLFGERLEPCRACLACRGGGACPIDDAMPAILDKLAGADFVVMASPLHFTSLTAPLVAFISRLQPFWHARNRGGAVDGRPPGRQSGALVVTGGANYPNMFRPARSVALAAFKSLDIPFAGMLAVPDTDRVPARDNFAAHAEAAALADSLRTMRGNGQDRGPDAQIQ